MAKPVFKAASPEQCAKRKEDLAADLKRNFEAFQQRKDVIRQDDGSYDVEGDVEDPGSLDFKRLAARYGKVVGNFSCGGTLESLEGTPRVIGGNFSFHGELQSLKGFPEEVKGNVLFMNHPIHGNRLDAKRWAECDIREACHTIGGRVTVENHEGI